MDVLEAYRTVPLDADGYAYELQGPDYRVWINHRALPSAGVYCAPCRGELGTATVVKKYCKACALELNPQDSIMSEKGERFRSALESWLYHHTSMNVLEASLLTYEIQEFIIKTAWASHEHHATKMGWRQ